MGRKYFLILAALLFMGCEKDILTDTTSHKKEEIQTHKEFWIRTPNPIKLQIQMYTNGAPVFTQLYSGGGWQKLNYPSFNNGYAVVKVIKGFYSTKKLEVNQWESIAGTTSGFTESQEYAYDTYGNQFIIPLIVY
jgi:hypothetical protein